MEEIATKSKQLYWNRKMIEKFIELYKENVCLYDKSNENYHKSGVKNHALQSIVQKMREYMPELELEDVQDKIKEIRTQLSEEISFINKAKSADENYTPKLWCFNQLEFLLEHLTLSMTDCTIKEENSLLDNSNNYADNQSEDSDVSLYTEIQNSKPKRSYSRKFMWTRENLKDFIRILKKYPMVYDSKHKDYLNRDIKCKAFNKMLKEIRTINRNINLEAVRDKMRCLRKQYMKELRCIKKANQCNNSYTPKLWCFENLANLYNTDANNAKSYCKSDFENTSQADDYSLSTSEAAIDNELFEFEEVHQVVVETDDQDYDEETVNLTNNSGHPQNTVAYECVNSFDGDLDLDLEPAASAVCNMQAKERKKSGSSDVNYEWLGDLVMSQLGEISRKYQNDFAWDLQCLIRKYVLKSKSDNEEQQSSSGCNKDKSSTPHDMVLSRNSNISLNISIV